MGQWVRLWDDMPTDPKWRVIAKRSGRPISEVIAVFVFMMTNAGASHDRGSLSGWDDEDVAAALDIDGEHVCAIREAMQGKTLDGSELSGWARRQPKRDDSSADRTAAYRERKKVVTQCDAPVTQCDAPEEKRRDTDTDNSSATHLSTALPVDEPAIEPKNEKRKDDRELIQTVVDEWNGFAASLRLPTISHVTQKRQSAVLNRAKELVEFYDFPDPLTGFRQGLFSKIRGSPFLRGEAGTFRADFDFAFTQSSFTKIMEGRYEGSKANSAVGRRF
jgi:hypothetical protein